MVCAKLLQRSGKPLGKTAWFCARAQLGNSGVFYSLHALGAPWDIGVIAPQSSFYLILTVTASPGPSTAWGVVSFRGCGKRLCGSLLFAPAALTSASREEKQTFNSAGPALAHLSQPTRRATVPVRSRWWISGKSWICFMLLIHQTLLRSCLNKHRETYNQLFTKFHNSLHFY